MFACINTGSSEFMDLNDLGLFINSAEHEEEAPVEEEGPKEMTLDEYKAQQSQERKIAAFNIRKAGEGVDGGQWKKTFVLQKKQPEIESEEEESDEDEVSIIGLLIIFILMNEF